MAAPTYTYTLTNGSTADAAQVMQNFTDVLNGITDGSKDLTINALTCNGAVAFGDDVTLGDNSADDVTVNGSLASTINIKTTFSYDIGSNALGLRYIFLGSADSAARSTKIAGATIASAYTYTLPTSGGTSRFRQLTNGSGTNSYEECRGSQDLQNIGITATVATNALTVALKGANGSDPSSTNVVEIGFRSSTAATGTPALRTVTGALSVVVSAGSTLGHADGIARYIYVYAIDNAGTVELAVSSVLFDEGTRQSTTAEGGAGAADSGATLYSTTARSNVGIRLIGRLSSTQATAGTWATAISEISLNPFDKTKVVAVYKSNAGLSLTSGAQTVVDFEDKAIDTHNAVTTGTWVFTAPKSGKYMISSYVRLSSATTWDSNEGAFLTLQKGGVDEVLLDTRFSQATSNPHTIALSSGGYVIGLDPGETLRITVQQNSGGAITINNSGTNCWVSIAEV